VARLTQALGDRNSVYTANHSEDIVQMKYIDPLPVKCPHCGEIHKYSVEDMRHFRSSCLTCNYDLASIGEEMRENEAYWAFVSIDLAGFVLRLEDKLHIHYEDKEVESLETLEEAINLTCTKLPSDYNVKQLKQLILETASEVGNYSVDQLDMKMSLRKILEKSGDP
jgi:acyl carrier protein